MRLGDLRQRKARQIGVAQLEHPRGQSEEPPVAPDVAEPLEGQQEAPRRRARETGRARDLGKRLARSGRAQRADHRQAAPERLDVLAIALGRNSQDVSSSTRCAIAKAELAAGTPAYTAVCSSTSPISSGVKPMRSAARTCISSSPSRPSAASRASVRQLRVRRSRPSRAQTLPHAKRVMKSWKSAVKG